MTPLLVANVAHPPRLAEVTLAAKSGERIAVIGPNGSGKTSLLRALAGILDDRRPRGGGDLRSGSAALSGVPASAGTTVMGEEITAASPARRRKLLSFLPAAREVAWPIPVRDVIALGLDRPDPARIEELLGALDLAALAERPVDTLSTGERARALLARALAPAPRLLLLDEPLSNLDPAWSLRILDLLDAVAADGSTLLLALHDLSLLHRFDRVLLMERGVLRADMAPEALLGSALFGEVFGVEPAQTGWRLKPSADPRSSP